MDLISNLTLQARLIRRGVGQNQHRVCGFVYRVEGTQVIRENPDHTEDRVESRVEIEEGLTSYQKALLKQNKERAGNVL